MPISEPTRSFSWIDRGSITWVGVKEAIKRGVDVDAVPDLDQWAYELVPDALNDIFGKQGWLTERRPKKDDPAKTVLWVTIVPEGEEV